MLTKRELETIINFNKEERTAYIFTYEKTWQQHMEKKLGIKPILVNDFGGREYLIDKSRIKMPRVPMKLSPEQRKASRDRLRESVLSRKSSTVAMKSRGQKKDARD